MYSITATPPANDLLKAPSILRAGTGPVVISAILSACLIFQIFLSTSFYTVCFCGLSLLITMLPTFIYGRDLYTVLCMVFGMRYTGVALIAKTAYGQSLDERLADPSAAYGLTLLILTLYTATILICRNVDKGKDASFFPSLPTNKLRFFSFICFGVGGLANISEIIAGANNDGGPGGGAALIFSASLMYIFPTGLIAESIYISRTSRGATFISPLLIFGCIFLFISSAASNAREFFITCLIGIFITAYLNGTVRWRHVIFGGLLISVFLFFISPVLLYVRGFKDSLSRAELLTLTLEVMTEAATDPVYYDRIYAVQQAGGLDQHGVSSQYDYYGNTSNTLNRLSFVALVDTMYSYIRLSPPVGMIEVEEAIERILPSFVFKKTAFSYSTGDLLAWNIGAESTTTTEYINFALPMEGLAVWGPIGLILYNFMFPMALLLFIILISSMRTGSIVAIGFFVLIQHGFVEGTSDIILNLILRLLPIYALAMSGIYLLTSYLSAKALPVNT